MNVKYQYVIIRYRPSYSRGEFINLGILMWAENSASLLYRFNKNWGRVFSFFPSLKKDDFFQKCVELYEILDSGIFEGPEEAQEHLVQLQRTVLTQEGCFPASYVRVGVT